MQKQAGSEHPAAMQTNAAPVLLSFSPSSYLSWKRMMPTMLLPLLSLCLSLQHLPLSLHNTS
ncbi:hypothetical protein E2C01_062657 [Portunus trituberculatus]|uniref:Uncharacterized protein n=1 Tax=Portunus trituberculatus TaxID=210409 RepID=A0A5B7HFV4_PORTR|nr:hypothetical protein [Portunus trituberculatus]